MTNHNNDLKVCTVHSFSSINQMRTGTMSGEKVKIVEVSQCLKTFNC